MMPGMGGEQVFSLFFLFPLCKVLLASDATGLGAFAKT